MAEPSKQEFSQSWPAVRELRPRLRAHVEIHRHVFRGRCWYVLQDHVSGRFHRFSPAAHGVIALLDGERTLETVWDIAQRQFPGEAPSQDEVIDIVAKLYVADAIVGDMPPDIEELNERGKRLKKNKLVARFKTPLAVRVPLFDPDKFLNKTIGAVRPLLSPIGLIFWIVVVATGAVLTMINSDELFANLSDRVLSADNLPILWLSFLVIKTVHELGHAYVIKRWGGEVHEIGVMFLVFFPVPYVDAGASTAFLSKWSRAAVGAAGIMMELFIAALAIIIWVNAEPGLLRAAAFNAAFIAGVSTLFFNGNPLLRFDGYYVFSDLLESPNLGPRANKYLLHLIGKNFLSADGLQRPIITGAERWQLPLYGIASFIYRMFIMVVIISFVATKFFFIGVLIAIWSAFMIIIWPVYKGIRFLFTSFALSKSREQAFQTVGASAAAVIAFFFMLPAPWATLTQGVIWIQEESVVRSNVAGFVPVAPEQPEAALQEGAELLQLDAPILAAELAVFQSALREAEAQLASVDTIDQVATHALQRKIDHLTEQVRIASQRVGDRTVIAPTDGMFLAKDLTELNGRFLDRGAVVGYIFDAARPTVVVVARKEDIDLVRQRNRGVKIKLSSDPGKTYKATLSLISPASTSNLPTPALTTLGGGNISIDPTAGDAMKALEDLFILELTLPPIESLTQIGERVYVRFDHGYNPIGFQMARAFRQVFLERFDV